MTRGQAYERKADEAEAMALIARTQEARHAMRDLASRWRALAAQEQRGALALPSLDSWQD